MTRPRGALLTVAVLLTIALAVGVALWLFDGEDTSPGTSIRSLIVETASSELAYWDKGELDECDDRAVDRLRTYWDVALSESAPDCSAVPWSAVFVSYVERTAGAGHRFGYSSQHSRYIGDAILDRYQNKESLYRAYSPSEVSPRPGDLVCAGRDQPTTWRDGDHASLDFDDMAERARMAGRGHTSFFSHCDIVIAVSPDRVEVVGGNVDDSVRKTELRMQDGHLVGAADEVRQTAVVLVLNSASG